MFGDSVPQAFEPQKPHMDILCNLGTARSKRRLRSSFDDMRPSNKLLHTIWVCCKWMTRKDNLV
eukprot:2823524-Amphidinium_carterae.1